MSVKVSSWVWHETPAEVKGNRLVVLLALADIADDSGLCRFADDTSQRALAAKARIGISTFREVTAWLVEHDYLEALRESATAVKEYSIVMPATLVAPPGSGGGHRRKLAVAPPESGGHSSIDVTDVSSAFERFWKAYPRHVAKATAKAKFEAIAKHVDDIEMVVAGAVRYAADPNLPEPKYIPHPTTWLNGGRWEDDPLPKRDDRPAEVRDVGVEEWMLR